MAVKSTTNSEISNLSLAAAAVLFQHHSEFLQTDRYEETVTNCNATNNHNKLMNITVVYLKYQALITW